MKKLWWYVKPFSSWYRNVRDRQTDGQICYINIARQYADARYELATTPASASKTWCRRVVEKGAAHAPLRLSGCRTVWSVSGHSYWPLGNGDQLVTSITKVNYSANLWNIDTDDVGGSVLSADRRQFNVDWITFIDHWLCLTLSV